MNGLTFEETVQRYAWLSGLPMDVAREQMRQQLVHTFTRSYASIGEGLAAGIRSDRERLKNLREPRPPRRAARRAHKRKVKRG